jgi:uncharacterized protein YdhG (YjbR/CyaY superfamily)
MKSAPVKTIDDYIARCPGDLQPVLEKIRDTIREAAPDAEECISYQMPAFRHNGVLVYFALFADHISFFPTASGVAKFAGKLLKYKTFKGTVQFPLGQPIPYGLIAQITKFRVKENLARKRR